MELVNSRVNVIALQEVVDGYKRMSYSSRVVHNDVTKEQE